MSRRCILLLAGSLLASALTAAPARAAAYSMEVLVDGRPRPVFASRGASYIAALEGREYAIRLTNHTGARVAVALAVDGLNSIDAKHTPARQARKWILGPWETITVPGWQTAAGTARRFVFTTEDRSYGTWLGRTADLGVISAAFFRERAPRPAVSDERSVSGGVEGGAAEPMAGRSAPSAKDELAATGIGRRVDHQVVSVDFDEDDAPASVVSLRYEYRDALVRLGVFREPCDGEALARRERARGFSDDGFAPDPGRGRR